MEKLSRRDWLQLIAPPVQPRQAEVSHTLMLRGWTMMKTPIRSEDH
jgi:hypothetical protein